MDVLKFADMSEERRAVQEQRRTIAGRKVSAGGTLFFLTVFQLLLAACSSRRSRARACTGKTRSSRPRSPSGPSCA